MLKPMNKRVILKLDERIKNKVKLGGYEFHIDTAFRQFHNAVQNAEVVAAGDGCDLKPGNKVYCHHFVLDNENKLPFKDGHYSWVEYNNVYCKMIDGEPEMLSDWLLVEPVTADNEQFFDKSEYGLILSTKQGTTFLDRIGIIKHISENGFKAGLREGDKVIFGKNCEYDLNIDGKIYFRMEIRDVITVLDDDVRIQSIM
jgi:co-chaperonin GroES (HSP10)